NVSGGEPPAVSGGGPGANTLQLGSELWTSDGVYGTVQVGNRTTLFVVKFTNPRNVTKPGENKEHGPLLMKIPVPEDEASYGKYNKYGKWTGTEYKGHKNLPPAFWIYEAPYWNLYELPK